MSTDGREELQWSQWKGLEERGAGRSDRGLDAGGFGGRQSAFHVRLLVDSRGASPVLARMLCVCVVVCM